MTLGSDTDSVMCHTKDLTHGNNKNLKKKWEKPKTNMWHTINGVNNFFSDVNNFFLKWPN